MNADLGPVEIERVVMLQARFYGARKYINGAIFRDLVAMSEYFNGEIPVETVIYHFFNYLSSYYS